MIKCLTNTLFYRLDEVASRDDDDDDDHDSVHTIKFYHSVCVRERGGGEGCFRPVNLGLCTERWAGKGEAMESDVFLQELNMCQVNLKEQQGNQRKD